LPSDEAKVLSVVTQYYYVSVFGSTKKFVEVTLNIDIDSQWRLVRLPRRLRMVLWCVPVMTILLTLNVSFPACLATLSLAPDIATACPLHGGMVYIQPANVSHLPTINKGISFWGLHSLGLAVGYQLCRITHWSHLQSTLILRKIFSSCGCL